MSLTIFNIVTELAKGHVVRTKDMPYIYIRQPDVTIEKYQAAKDIKFETKLCKFNSTVELLTIKEVYYNTPIHMYSEFEVITSGMALIEGVNSVRRDHIFNQAKEKLAVFGKYYIVERSDIIEYNRFQVIFNDVEIPGYRIYDGFNLKGFGKTEQEALVWCWRNLKRASESNYICVWNNREFGYDEKNDHLIEIQPAHGITYLQAKEKLAIFGNIPDYIDDCICYTEVKDTTGTLKGFGNNKFQALQCVWYNFTCIYADKKSYVIFDNEKYNYDEQNDCVKKAILSDIENQIDSSSELSQWEIKFKLLGEPKISTKICSVVRYQIDFINAEYTQDTNYIANHPWHLGNTLDEAYTRLWNEIKHRDTQGIFIRVKNVSGTGNIIRYYDEKDCLVQIHDENLDLKANYILGKLIAAGMRVRFYKIDNHSHSLFPCHVIITNFEPSHLTFNSHTNYSYALHDLWKGIQNNPNYIFKCNNGVDFKYGEKTDSLYELEKKSTYDNSLNIAEATRALDKGYTICRKLDSRCYRKSRTKAGIYLESPPGIKSIFDLKEENWRRVELSDIHITSDERFEIILHI